MPKVESSMMTRVAYREAAMELDIAFRSGSSYTYFGVPTEIYAGLLAAASKGRFFHEAIDGTFRYVVSARRKSRGNAGE